MVHDASYKYRDHNLVMIAAVSENNVIGKDGDIPWKISSDLKRFNEVTSGYKVIMGRKTYESIPKRYRPLPKRENIILSGNLDQSNLPSEVKVFDSIDSILDYINGDRAFVIGGESVYRDFLEYARRLDITKVHRVVEGDTFFPEIDDDLWKLVCKEYHEEVGRDYLERFSFLSYVRKQP